MRAVETIPGCLTDFLAKDKGLFSILIKLKHDRHSTKTGQVSIYFVVSANFFCQLSVGLTKY